MSKATPPQSTRVLVVDDFRTVRSLVIQFLGEGFSCVQASNGQEALLEIKARPPEVVITDLNMPVMDGMEFLRCLRSNSDPEIAKIPVIVLSTSVKRDSALDIGANAVVAKLISAAEIRAVVERVLNRSPR